MNTIIVLKLVILISIVVSDCRASMDSFAAVTEKIRSFFVSDVQDKPARRAHLVVLSLTGFIQDEKVWVKKFYDLSKDDSVDGILLCIDSGGGLAGSGQLMYEAVKACRSCKPVVVLVSNVCCSAAYMVALGADCIVAPSLADVGSIGIYRTVIKKKPTGYKDPLDGTEGEYSVELFGSSKHKVLWNPYGPTMTDEDKEKIHADLAEFYKIFCELVARERSLDLEDHMVWGDAQVFSGKRAQELGLIDEVGSYGSALEKLGSLVFAQNSAVFSDDPKIEFVDVYQ